MKTKPLYFIFLLIAFCLSWHGIRGQSIVEAEYFVDTDPGIGNGQSIAFATANTIDVSLDIPANTFSNGHHILYTRVKNSNSEWSLCGTQNFYVYTAPTTEQEKISYGEYYIDTDPGINKATSFSFIADDTIDENIVIPANTLQNGHHTLYVRVKNSNNQWSSLNIQNFYVYTAEPAGKKLIESVEYFFDSDPGIDSANHVNYTTPAGTADELFNISTNGLNTGFHLFGVRAKDASGKYSFSQNSIVYIDAPDTASPIVSAEYFIDTITGIGKGTPVTAFAKTDTLNGQANIPLSGVSAGDHKLIVVVKDERGRSSLYKSADFTVCDVLPKANFIADFNKADSTVLFSSTTTGYDGETVYSWDVDGNGTNDYTDPDFVHKYSALNTYKVRLIAANSAACRDTITKFVYADPDTCKLNAAFTYTARILNNEVLFVNASTGLVSKYYWDFGDGATSAIKNPIHEYAAPGYYLVTMSIKKANSKCADTYSEVIKVGTSACRSHFVYTKNSNTITFSNQSLGTSLRYFWYFGDGTYSTDEDPIHTFEKDGLYKVTLSVSNPTEDCSNEYSEFIEIGQITCNAQFAYFVDSVTKTVTFNNEQQSRTTKLMWTFGDGSQSVENNPSHAYKHNGIFKVNLFTYNATDGCMDNFEKNIFVGTDTSFCNADFIYQSASDNLEVSLYDNSKGDIIGYVWNFGDGNPNTKPVGGGADKKNVKYTYNKAGYYNVCHLVLSAQKQIDLVCKPVVAKIGDPKNCLADFHFTIDSVSRKVTLLDNSDGKPDTWNWSFNNNNSSTLQNPTVTYAQSGYYLISLSISNSTTGCKSTAYKMVNVAKPYQMQAGFGFTQSLSTKKAGGYPVDFTGAGLGDEARLKWDFGDGETDTTTTSPSHEYLTGDTTYRVCYEIHDPVDDQSDTICQDVYVSKATNIKTLAANKLSVFPNPVGDKITVAYSTAESGYIEIQIIDIEGRLVSTLINNYKSKGDFKFSYNTSSLAKGTYVLILNSSSAGTERRMIIKK